MSSNTIDPLITSTVADKTTTWGFKKYSLLQREPACMNSCKFMFEQTRDRTTDDTKQTAEQVSTCLFKYNTGGGSHVCEGCDGQELGCGAAASI